MVQEDKDKTVRLSTLHLTYEDPMNAKKTAPARSTTRVSQHEYLSLATILQHEKLEVTPTNVVLKSQQAIGRKLPLNEVTPKRMQQISSLIRDLDAADAAMARSKITGTIEGLKKGETADLLIKSIVTAAVQAGTQQALEGMRKLMLAQEARFQQRQNRTEKILANLCKEWGIPTPELDEPSLLPAVEAGGQVVRLPRVLVYGMQPNQKQPMYDLIRSWDLNGVADVDMGYSRDPVSTMKRGYDVVIYNRHWVGVDDVRELKSHGVKIVEASGALSDVGRKLQVELLELAIEAKKKDGQA